MDYLQYLKCKRGTWFLQGPSDLPPTQCTQERCMRVSQDGPSQGSKGPSVLLPWAPYSFHKSNSIISASAPKQTWINILQLWLQAVTIRSEMPGS